MKKILSFCILFVMLSSNKAFSQTILSSWENNVSFAVAAISYEVEIYGEKIYINYTSQHNFVIWSPEYKNRAWFYGGYDCPYLGMGSSSGLGTASFSFNKYNRKKKDFYYSNDNELINSLEFISIFSDNKCTDEELILKIAREFVKNQKEVCKYPDYFNTSASTSSSSSSSSSSSTSSSSSASTPTEYDVDITDSRPALGIEMVLVQGGPFQMGNNTSSFYAEHPAHSVTINSFYLSNYEVTQAQWKKIMGTNPSNFSGCSNCPVEQVSWDDVQQFITKLNAQTGKKYRLPTEAEWEYAARGGIKSKGYIYAGSNNLDEVAWYSGNNNNNRTMPVGKKNPNELGIFDMSGNVYEFCSDFFDQNYYQNSQAINPKGPSTGTERVIRGGSWSYGGEYECKIFGRSSTNPDQSYKTIGFRLVSAK